MAPAAFVPSVTRFFTQRASLSVSLSPLISHSPARVAANRTARAPFVSPEWSPFAPLFDSPAPPAPARAPSRIAVWFLADLRVEDNAALCAAADAAVAAGPTGALIPVVASGSSVTASTAADARAQLEKLGSGLIAVNTPADIVSLCQQLKLDAVYYNRAVRAEDVEVQARVERELRNANVQVQAFWSNVLCEPRDNDLTRESTVGLAHLYNRIVSNPSAVKEPIAAPTGLPKLPSAAVSLDVGILSKVCAGVDNASSRASAAFRILNDRCTKRAERGFVAVGRPDLSVLLKSYLDQGILSPRMVARHIKKVVGSLSGITFGELVWRDYMSIASYRAAGSTVATTPVAA